MAWFYAFGIWPGRLSHRDYNSTDNRLSNIYEESTKPEKIKVSVPLTEDRLKEVLCYCPTSGEFTWKVTTLNTVIGQIAGCINKSNGYVNINVDNKKYRAHRLAWFYVHGVWPISIDHRDTIKHHNWLNNLREASKPQNGWNRGKLSNNTSGFKGVSYHKGTKKWIATCCLNSSKHHLGVFSTPELASAAYQAFAEENHGEFLRL